MSFVPTTVVVPAAANVSPRARDLARTLDGSVQEFRQRNPSLTDDEVRQALALLQSQRRMAGNRSAMIIGLILGVLLLGLGVFYAAL